MRYGHAVFFQPVDELLLVPILIICGDIMGVTICATFEQMLSSYSPSFSDPHHDDPTTLLVPKDSTIIVDNFMVQGVR